MKIHELRDIKAIIGTGIQIDSRNRIWVCVDGQCVLRVVGSTSVEIMDDRKK